MNSNTFYKNVLALKDENISIPIVSAIGGEEYYVRRGIQRLNDDSGKEFVIIRATKNCRGVYNNFMDFDSDLTRVLEGYKGSIYIEFDTKPGKYHSIMTLSVGNSDHAPIPTPKNWPVLFKIWSGVASYRFFKKEK